MLEVLSGIDNPKKYGIKYVCMLEIECNILGGMIFLYHFNLPKKKHSGNKLMLMVLLGKKFFVAKAGRK